MLTYYVYLWLREDGSPYYVGKGRGRRGFTDSGHIVRCPKDISRIIVQEYSSEQDAFAAEVFFISYFGRADLSEGCLRNLTNGGNGVSGFLPSIELRHRWSEYRRQHPSCGFRGRKHSAETRIKMRTLNKGEANPFFNKTHSSATRLAVSDSNKRRHYDSAVMSRIAKQAIRIRYTRGAFC